jgi:GNAT superfamily N-acetyltransferase
LLRLDPETRHNRFAGTVSERFLHTYAERALAAEGATFGYVVDGQIRATAELRPFGDRQGEAAFTVEGSYRRRGIGIRLFRRVALAARNLGLAMLHTRCLAQNRAMQALARKAGARLIHDPDGKAALLEVERMTPFSLMQEAFETGLDLALTFTANGPPGPGGLWSIAKRPAYLQAATLQAAIAPAR